MLNIRNKNAAIINPSHAPRDQVRTRQAQQSANAEKYLNLVWAFFEIMHIAKIMGAMRMRYSPSTLGFSNVDTARPRISANIAVSCHIVETAPKKYWKMPKAETPTAPIVILRTQQSASCSE